MIIGVVDIVNFFRDNMGLKIGLIIGFIIFMMDVFKSVVLD